MKPALTAAERNAQNTALVLRNNSASRFCTSYARDPYGINTETRQDRDKTHALKRASI